MKWAEGCGLDLPKGTLAWVEHPVHGVVWAEKDFYIDSPGADDGDSEEIQEWMWCAYGAGEVFRLAEVLRHQVVPRPESTSEQWLSKPETIGAIERAYARGQGQVSLGHLKEELEKL